MIGERVSYCFNNCGLIRPTPTGYGSTLSLHAGAARLAATPPPTFSYQALSSRRATAGPRWSTPCLWPGPSLERDRHRHRGSKPPPVFRLLGVVFCVAGARRSLPLCLVRAVWWPRRGTRRRIKILGGQYDRCFFGFGGCASSGGRTFASASAARSLKCLLLYVPLSSKLRRALSLFERCFDLTPSSPEPLRGIVACGERDASRTSTRRAPIEYSTWGW